ncbi:MAG: twin-arginine translocase TatA/TatE family subunit [Chloroflexia bacterium]|nr:twin-arginine translocase TatA/TatE family subunit [Chloroflexia bacterium]
MNIMGIGPQEMMVIAVIALLVFGPGKLPEVMGQAGKLVRDFRRMSAELSGEFEKTIAEAKDMTSGLSAELGGMTKEVNSVTNSVKKDLGLKGSGVTGRAKGSAAKTGTASKAGSTSKTSSTSKAGSSKTGAKTTASSSGAKTTGAKSTSGTTTSTKSTAAKKAPTPVASREDPSADMSLFEPAPVERAKRTRKAVPSMISDPTPRSVGSANDRSPMFTDDDSLAPAASGTDDALSRARQRRRTAGYTRPSA